MDQRSERGAALVFAVLVLTTLLGFLVFVIDYGVLLAARGQAQNAADAAALAAAVSLGFDEVAAGPVAGGAAETAATRTVEANRVWGEAGTSQVLWDAPNCPSGVAGSCIRVNVYRNGENGSNPLSTFFGPVLGITTQRVRATATAESAAANATECERPFAIPDPMLGVANLGADVVLRNVGGAGTVQYSMVDVWGGGEPDTRTAMRRCAIAIYGVGDALPSASPVMTADVLGIVAGVQDVISLDPDAVWDVIGLHVNGSCVETRACQKWNAAGTDLEPDLTATVSPRIFTLPIFDPAVPPGGPSLSVINHLALFVEDARQLPTGEVEIVGKLVTSNGVLRPNGAPPALNSAFLRTARLVR
jgi:Flp pilus assembly protein TadG